MLSKDIPTPYVWSYQPQMGVAAGASQDYSTRINWLSAGPAMSQHIFEIRDQRNNILSREAEFRTPRNVINPPSWPAGTLPQVPPTSYQVSLPRNESLEQIMTNSGFQFAGGSRPLCLTLKSTPFVGKGIQLAESSTPAGVRSDGIFQLAGGRRQPSNYLLLNTASSQPRSGGIGSAQFVREFSPSVYINPFSGPPDTFPDQFCSNYDIITNSVDGYS
ncbi:pVIII [California sea lion adenovirus 1]|uniref:Pre-hexon-linking protein VIII n=1 Tax=California sea lion adenovirus 1 TaxID=943083 RepID=A0A059XNA2_9ADEN|nr:pVIII [California sea lion adenovirus 1]AIA22363.1 pVIII [California sea lion adenovirus 1]